MTCVRSMHCLWRELLEQLQLVEPLFVAVAVVACCSAETVAEAVVALDIAEAAAAAAACSLAEAAVAVDIAVADIEVAAAEESLAAVDDPSDGASAVVAAVDIPVHTEEVVAAVHSLEASSYYYLEARHFDVGMVTPDWDAFDSGASVVDAF